MTLEGHDSSVMCAQFLSRGTQIVSAGADGLLKLWNIKTSECVKTFEHHEGKVWTLVVSHNEEHIITGGADSCLVVWKDVTEETRAEAAKTKQDQVLQEQELANLMHSDQMLPALKLALTLERPVATLKVVESLIKQDNANLSTTVKQLREDQKQVLLKFATHWNSNSKNCQAAQMIISVLLDCVSDGTLTIPQLTLETLLPYTERHFKRMTQLLQDLHFLQYTAAVMQPHGT